jgi:hypothetical protein
LLLLASSKEILIIVKIDLKDAIISLQISAGMNATVPAYIPSVVNEDGKIGTSEVIYILQTAVGLRPMTPTTGSFALSFNCRDKVVVQPFPIRVVLSAE